MVVFIAVFLVVIMSLSIYFMIRNKKVYRFRQECIESGHNNLRRRVNMLENELEGTKELSRELEILDRDTNRLYEILTKYSYERMLFSFKSLKVESWYTEDERKLINLK